MFGGKNTANPLRLLFTLIIVV